MAELEGPDQQIGIVRAAELAGLLPRTLRQAAHDGRLNAVKIGRDYLTTRRQLHAYLIARSRGVIKPLPQGYVAPETEGE